MPRYPPDTVCGQLPTDGLRTPLYAETAAPREALGQSERRPPLSIVALILTILGLGFLIVLWVSIAMSLVFLVRGGLARTFG